MHTLQDAGQDKPKGTHGGARPRAGRTWRTDKLGGTKRVTMSLDQETVELFRAYGNGNVSHGARCAARIIERAKRANIWG